MAASASSTCCALVAPTIGAVTPGLRQRAGELKVEMDFRQTNLEGELVSWIQQAKGRFDVIVIGGGHAGCGR